MKHRIILPIALTLIPLISLVGFAPTAQAQQKFKPVADTGEVTLGANQILRLTVVAGDVNGDGFAVRFGKVSYMPLGCNADGVCKQSVASQSLSAPVMLNPGEAASMDLTFNGQTTGIRAIILSNSPNVRVSAMIIDATTGNIIAFPDISGFVGKGGAT
jgi:hypothetical protein